MRGLKIFMWRMAGICLVAMVLLTVAEAILRKFGHPIYGAYEMINFLLCVCFFASMTYCSLESKHFSVDFLIRNAAGMKKKVLGNLSKWAAVVAFTIGSFTLVWLSHSLYAFGLSGTQFAVIPLYPFAIFGCWCFVLALLGTLWRGRKREG